MTTRLQQLQKVSARTWLVMFSVLVLMWLGGIALTEYTHPMKQIVAVTSRLPGGPKYARTLREEETMWAVSCLYRAFNAELVPIEWPLPPPADFYPKTWNELIAANRDARGRLFRDGLAARFPLLHQPLDPWGHPWVCRLEIVPAAASEELFPVERTSEFLQAEFVFGSTGPDGVECPVDSRRVDDNRLFRSDCDDLLVRRKVALPKGQNDNPVPGQANGQ